MIYFNHKNAANLNISGIFITSKYTLEGTKKVIDNQYYCLNLLFSPSLQIGFILPASTQQLGLKYSLTTWKIPLVITKRPVEIFTTGLCFDTVFIALLLRFN